MVVKKNYRHVSGGAKIVVNFGGNICVVEIGR
jgi:hypothetical protein